MRRRVGITGLGCICALGSDPRSLWTGAAAGRSGIGPITRFDAARFEVHLGGEVKGEPLRTPGCEEAVGEDPKLAFALHAARQAMEDAGLTSFDAGTLLHLGTSLEYFDPRKIVQEGSALFGGVVERSLRAGARPLQVPLDTASRILERLYGTPAWSLVNVSACAASTQAIGHAFRRIRDGSFDTALCGGFDSMLNPFGVGGFQLLGALTTDDARGERACRPFDAARTGTVLGEGAACFVLEPLERALAEGKRVHGEVLGFGSSLDAYKLSAPDPDGAGASAAMTSALADSGLGPDDVDAVSAHATGTLLNDEVEAAALRRLLGPRWERVPVLATKSLVGHLIGASGAVEVVACLQGFAEDRLHPNGSLQTVAAGCELDHVVGVARPFSGRTILKNSFGFGGQNASLVLGRVTRR